MLGKLLKYELKSTARIFVPFYAAVLVLSVLNRILFVVMDSVKFLDIPRFLVMATYVFLIIATFVMTYVIMIQRFYKNLLGEEGYLSMTLPVKTSSHVLSKGIASAIWLLSTLLITFVSILVMIPNYSFVPEFMSDVATASEDFKQLTGVSLGLVFTLFAILMFVAIISSILMIYTAISFGQLSNSHKVLTSFAAYVGIYFIVQTVNASILGVIASVTKNQFDMFVANSSSTSLNSIPGNIIIAILAGVICVSIALTTAFFFVTRYLLDKKLNLE